MTIKPYYVFGDLASVTPAKATPLLSLPATPGWRRS